NNLCNKTVRRNPTQSTKVRDIGEDVKTKCKPIPIKRDKISGEISFQIQKRKEERRVRWGINDPRKEFLLASDFSSIMMGTTHQFRFHISIKQYGVPEKQKSVR
ncbi:hypothetical protein PanWU01x14_011390, partial [Parasponia andersonii]